MINARIITGHQTGVERAAMDVALEASMSCGGHCPKGKKDDLSILSETQTESNKGSAKINVLEAEIALIICESQLSRHSSLVKKICSDNNKPYEIVYAKKFHENGGFRGFMKYEHSVKDIIYALMGQKKIDKHHNSPLSIYITGTDEAAWPSGYNFTYFLLKEMFHNEK